KFFFFSSRRRHTRWPRDWSSDVCSSDLLCLKFYANTIDKWLDTGYIAMLTSRRFTFIVLPNAPVLLISSLFIGASLQKFLTGNRSEERRVGKECRSRW